jgi:hypothetical protein
MMALSLRCAYFLALLSAMPHIAALRVEQRAGGGAQLSRRAMLASIIVTTTCLPAKGKATEQVAAATTTALPPQEVRGTVNGVSAVVATEAEAAKLASEAAKLQLPNVPASSDLAKLLEGSSPPGSRSAVSDPRAHSN